jgi:hypothetical protein
MAELKFVDEIPKARRGSASGGPSVWAERLKPLLDHQGRVAEVYGPTNNPHATINNIRQQEDRLREDGVDLKDFTLSGRVLGTEVTTDEEGNEKEVKQGFVYARFDTPEQRQEREQKEAKRAEARKASENGEKKSTAKKATSKKEKAPASL